MKYLDLYSELDPSFFSQIIIYVVFLCISVIQLKNSYSNLNTKSDYIARDEFRVIIIDMGLKSAASLVRK